LSETIDIRQMTSEDIEDIYSVFTKNRIKKPKEYVVKCWEENENEDRTTLLAFYNGEFAGSLHLLEKSFYPYFSENGIPEINDFNVIEPLKRRGIGNQLMDAVEQTAKEQYGGIIGVGVGMHIYYGNAQRLYAKRGYVPDGRGLIYHNQQIMPGTEVCVDNDLILYMTKTL
jgi:GNAT superfamily N-acetyltransferase